MKSTLKQLAVSADAVLMRIADQFNGNAKRRAAIKQKMTVAMMATEGHKITAARYRVTNI